ncbi:MAG: complex I NDUFA9 subunit family protein [Rhodobacteraceae bacterium]|nr:complex I NDUFA9 subunit family protein [Paracoccaceae bacterium]MCY4196367.1 complex I NDUFA9 subunit family protein [Paracoccaceae bacterium]MCY4328287.1 complex I NDUFA9 subunit family protein [Paracoccaceae bacterium]
MASIATVFGGSGFVGRYIVQRLAKAGWRVRVAVRRPNEAIFVRPYGVPGQVEPVFANIRHDSSVAESMNGANAVINCVGILVESQAQSFDSLHCDAVRRIAQIASSEGVSRLVHISSIGADAASESNYARTKGEGELALAEMFPRSVILRPSIIFGPEDQFFNRFSTLARLSPIVPVVSGKSRFQPVFVGDVSLAALYAVENDDFSGIYELGGPEILSFHDLMIRMLSVIRRRRLVLDIPLPLARLKAGAFDILQFASGGLFTNRLLTRDQIKQLARDNIVSDGTKSFSDLNISPTTMESVLESYLYRFRPAGQFATIHESAELFQNDGRGG